MKIEVLSRQEVVNRFLDSYIPNQKISASYRQMIKYFINSIVRKDES